MMDSQSDANSISLEPKKSEETELCATEKVGELKEQQPVLSKRAEKKKRYDGRWKKRQWVANNRDRRAEDESDEKRVRPNPEERVKRRKYCMLLAYSGNGFAGMQRNPDVNTIEEELLKAMLKEKLITEEHFNQPQTIHFQRAARTDKGVSAARQCCSLKLPEEVNLEQLNANLPPQIKVLDLKRVTKGFNAKDQCVARSYSYTLPTVAFAPYKDTVDLQTYRVDEQTLAKVNDTLKLFEGTRNFHNFTSRKAFQDPSANRFIYNFQCQSPFLVRNVEFCVIIVKGQSFMLHQIRKMVGLTLAVVRGITPVETVLRSFKETRLDIPMAPGLGLVLDEVHYDGYNNRYGEDGMHVLLKWDDIEQQIQGFREEFIHPSIVETELNEKPMLKWLESLPWHSYDERPDDMKTNNEDGESCLEDSPSNDTPPQTIKEPLNEN